MIESRALKGVIPVVVTPLHENGAIDVEGQKRLIDFLVAKGVGGLWALGTGSEDMDLTFDQRLTAARAICEANAGRLPLVLGAGFFALADIVNFMDATSDLEFDAYHVMPYHPLLSMERVAWMYRYLADYASKPLWMYTSANWCQAFKPDFVAGLKDYPNIAGIKFSSSNTVDQLKVMAMQEPGFQTITAVANQWYAALAMGSPAGTTSLASALPEPLQEIYRLFQAGDLPKALDRQRNLMRFLAMMPKLAKRDNFLTGADEKYILSLRGICGPYMSGYYRPLDEDEQDQVRKALEACGYMPLVKADRVEAAE
jgi:dihydrodipicolinate synthase/N-acetylneuraminate lyase